MSKPRKIKQLRWRIYLRHKRTGERRVALAKHAEMLSEYEAKTIVKRTKGRMPDWEYVAEPLANYPVNNPHRLI